MCGCVSVRVGSYHLVNNIGILLCRIAQFGMFFVVVESCVPASILVNRVKFSLCRADSFGMGRNTCGRKDRVLGPAAHFCYCFPVSCCVLFRLIPRSLEVHVSLGESRSGCHCAVPAPRLVGCGCGIPVRSCFRATVGYGAAAQIPREAVLLCLPEVLMARSCESCVSVLNPVGAGQLDFGRGRTCWTTKLSRHKLWPSSESETSPRVPKALLFPCKCCSLFGSEYHRNNCLRQSSRSSLLLCFCPFTVALAAYVRAENTKA